MNYFSKNLNYLLKKEGLNKNKLSIMLNVTRQNMTYLFKASNPQLKTLIELKNIFNINIDDLVFKDLENEDRARGFNQINTTRPSM